MNLNNFLLIPFLSAALSCNPLSTHRILNEIPAVSAHESADYYTGDIAKCKQRVLEVATLSYTDVIRELKTPLEAHLYCTEHLRHAGINVDSEIYGQGDYWASFKEIHKNGRDDCDGGAIAAASILIDDGFPPHILLIEGSSSTHAVFIYRNKEGKYGSIGINKQDYILPTLDSPSKLAEKLSESVGLKPLEGYEIFNMNHFHPDFIFNDINNDPRRE